MNKILFKIVLTLHQLMKIEEGQDLVEYALVVALIAFGAVTAIHSFAGGINTAFTKVSGTLSSNVT